MALEQGKHTFIEKPVGVSIDELEKLKKLPRFQGHSAYPGIILFMNRG